MGGQQSGAELLHLPVDAIHANPRQPRNGNASTVHNSHRPSSASASTSTAPTTVLR